MTPERLPRRFRRLDRLEGAGAYARAGETLLRLSPIPTWKRRCPTPLRRLLLRLPGHKTWPCGELPPVPTSAHARLHWEHVRQAAIVDATAAAGRLGVPLPAWKELVP
jgi:hypothetical protein